MFRFSVAISGREKYSFELLFMISDLCSEKTVNIKKTIQCTFVILFFGLEILMPGIFLGLKFQACVFFGFAI